MDPATFQKCLKRHSRLQILAVVLEIVAVLLQVSQCGSLKKLTQRKTFWGRSTIALMVWTNVDGADLFALNRKLIDVNISRGNRGRCRTNTRVFQGTA